MERPPACVGRGDTERPKPRECGNVRRKWKLAGLFLLLGLFVCKPTCAQNSRAKPEHGSDVEMPRTIPLRIYRNFLLVAEGQFGTVLQHQNFVLDTGTAPSIVNARLARELGLVTTPGVMSAVGKIVSTQSATLREVELGPMRAVSLRVQVQDLSRLERDLGIPIAAIIGLDFLSRLSFRLDYDKKCIDFGDVSDQGIPVPFDAHTGIAIARVSIDGTPVRMLLDTGSDRVALIGGDFTGTARLGLPSASQEGWGVAGVPIRIFPAPDIFLGGEHFTLKKAYFILGSADPAFDGFLGVRALGFRTVAYDHVHATIYLQK